MLDLAGELAWVWLVSVTRSRNNEVGWWKGVHFFVEGRDYKVKEGLRIDAEWLAHPVLAAAEGLLSGVVLAFLLVTEVGLGVVGLGHETGLVVGTVLVVSLTNVRHFPDFFVVWDVSVTHLSLSIFVILHFIFWSLLTVSFSPFGVMTLGLDVGRLLRVCWWLSLVGCVVVVPFPITWKGFLCVPLLLVDPLILWSRLIICLRFRAVACLIFSLVGLRSCLHRLDLCDRNHLGWNLDPDRSCRWVKLCRLHLGRSTGLVGENLVLFSLKWSEADVYSRVCVVLHLWFK